MVSLFLILGMLFPVGDVLSEKKLVKNEMVTVRIDPLCTFQTIEGFGASDCWTAEPVGRFWSDEEKNKIARLLFCSCLGEDGNPQGIGLSIWRFNLGAGSAEQGEESNIRGNEMTGNVNELAHRRVECFLAYRDGVWTDDYDWNGKQQGQQWFLRAAKLYGCTNFTAFSNSPLVKYTRNGKAYAVDGNANIQTDKYDDYADYLATVLKHFQNVGLPFTYISPVNEPQHPWAEFRHSVITHGVQEGSPWQNSEIKRMAEALNAKLNEKLVDAKIILTDAGSWDDVNGVKTNGRAVNQIDELFRPESVNYVGDLNRVKRAICGHSYWTYATNEHLKKAREMVWNKAAAIGNLEVHQTEWSMIEFPKDNFPTSFSNAGYMDVALSMSKIIFADMYYARASSWSFWTSLDAERWRQKNRFYLIRLRLGGGDYQPFTNAGVAEASKNLWALGNYSLFVRPGYQRVALDGAANLNRLMGTAYLSPDGSRLVVVYVNVSDEACGVKQRVEGKKSFKLVGKYVTDASLDLAAQNISRRRSAEEIPPKSVVTLVYTVR